MITQPPFYQELFGGNAGAGGATRSMRLVRKNGLPLLLLPSQPGLAKVGWQMYPAQSAKARFAKSLLRTVAGAGVPLGSQLVQVPIHPDAPLPGFIRKVSGGKEFPEFAVLAGNPSDDSQRFIVLVFGEDGEPCVVVKAGTSDRARALVSAEANFLETVPKGTIGVPPFLGKLDDSEITALALPYVCGDRPSAQNLSAIQRLLLAWCNPDSSVSMRGTGPWPQFQAVCSANPEFKVIAQKLENLQVAKTLGHGDFAPWNLKILESGRCVALDWERGAMQGIPGWDYFHYLIQPAILVEHASTAELVSRLKAELNNAFFKDYCARAGIASGRDFLLAYLIFLTEIIKPAQGMQANRDLLAALLAQR